MQCIYQLNFTEGIYVGKTTNLKSRIAHHLAKNTGGFKLRDAWENQGYLGYVVLEECETAQLEQKEVYWIDKLKPSLNILPGGETMAGINHPCNKTSKEDIEEIVRLLIETELTYTEIADVVDLPKARVYDICKGRSHTWATEHLDLRVINSSRDNAFNTITVYDIDNTKHVIGYGEKIDFCTAANLPTTALRNLTDSFNIHGIALKKHKMFCVKTPDQDEVILTEPKLHKILRQEKSPGYAVTQVIKKYREYKGYKILHEVF